MHIIIRGVSTIYGMSFSLHPSWGNASAEYNGVFASNSKGKVDFIHWAKLGNAIPERRFVFRIVYA